ncbi:MAG: hypothetical protein PHQ40_15630 [Anaerolineaceae bacterium]|nr:hypothetical protein [Anaerolineaceae bacterium]
MTTSCFDGRFLAVDRASWKGNTWNEVEKLFQVSLHPDVGARFRLNDSRIIIWAAAGSAAEVPCILKWMEEGGDPPELMEKDYNCGLIVAISSRKAYSLTGLLTLEPFEKVPCADGGGHEMALGAMLAGANAKDAVEIVASRSSWAAGGVSVFDLDVYT